MINALWRFILTIIFVLSTLLTLAFVWDVPHLLGVELGSLSQLFETLLIILTLVTGIWGTWSRPAARKIEAQKAVHTTQGDIFATPDSHLRHEDLSMVEQANQTTIK